MSGRPSLFLKAANALDQIGQHHPDLDRGDHRISQAGVGFGAGDDVEGAGAGPGDTFRLGHEGQVLLQALLGIFLPVALNADRVDLAARFEPRRTLPSFSRILIASGDQIGDPILVVIRAAISARTSAGVSTGRPKASVVGSGAPAAPAPSRASRRMWEPIMFCPPSIKTWRAGQAFVQRDSFTTAVAPGNPRIRAVPRSRGQSRARGSGILATFAATPLGG